MRPARRAEHTDTRASRTYPEKTRTTDAPMPSPENAARASLPALLALSNTDPGKRLPPDRSRGAKAPHPRQTPNLPRRGAVVQHFFRRTGKKIFAASASPTPPDAAAVPHRSPNAHGRRHRSARRRPISRKALRTPAPAGLADGPPQAPPPPRETRTDAGRHVRNRPRQTRRRCRYGRTGHAGSERRGLSAPAAAPRTADASAAGAVPGTTPLPAFGPTAPNAGAGPARPSAHRRTG